MSPTCSPSNRPKGRMLDKICPLASAPTSWTFMPGLEPRPSKSSLYFASCTSHSAAHACILILNPGEVQMQGTP